MNRTIRLLTVLSCLLFPAAAQAPAARAQYQTPSLGDTPQDWDAIARSFTHLFKLHIPEVETADPNRFFSNTSVFVMTKMDKTGHFLVLKGGGKSGSASGRRNTLEERMKSVTLLEDLRTSERKDRLFNKKTWVVTPQGEEHLKKLRLRFPNLAARVGKLVAAALRR